jgi:uncharacterized membrane protein
MGTEASADTGLHARTPEHQRIELRREAGTNALYVSVVLLAELAALPQDHIPKGWAMIALIWGTTLGLALAHWFAFSVASSAIAGTLSRQDLEVGVAGVAGALFVALVASLPEVLFAARDAERVLLFVPATFIGIGGFFVARAADRSVRLSFLWALGFVFAGLTIAIVKVLLSH